MPVFLPATLLLTTLASAPLNTHHLDELAQARDVASLTQYLVEEPQGATPFTILKIGGAYDVGRFGWHAYTLQAPGSSTGYVVFTTPLTSEDTGELLFEIVGGKLKYIPESETQGISIRHHSFDVKFQLAAKQAIISDALDIIAPKTKELAQQGKEWAFLRLGPNYKLSSINGKHDFAQTGGIVMVRVTPGQQTLKLEYSGTVNQPQYAASISTDEATLTNDYWWPMIGRQPAPYDITVHAKKGWTAVGQGSLVSKVEAPTETIWKYDMKLPVCYYSLSVAPFKTVEREVHGRTYRVYSMEMTPEQMEYQTEFYPPIIEFYNDTFGPFPFNGYAAVVSKTYGGGALEAYSFATYGTGWLPAEDAHEPSHTWWGGIIPNSYLKSFWNESFADYSDRLFKRSVPIGNKEERNLAFVSHPQVNAAYNAAPLEKAGVDIGKPADSLGYGKGSFVLDQLEKEVGTPTMMRCLHEWVSSHPKQTLGEWPEFEKAVNSACGKDMSWFFDEWTKRPGYIETTFGQPVFNGGRNGAVVFPFSNNKYRFKMDVWCGYGDGVEGLSEVTVPAQESGWIVMPMQLKPNLVSIDPYRRLIRKFANDEAPLSAEWALGRFTRYVEKGAAKSLTSDRDKPLDQLPKDLDRCTIVGDPRTIPGIAPLLSQAGFTVSGNKLTFDGSTIDLDHECAVALLELKDGKHVLLALGHPDLPPSTGDAQIALTDHLGRFLRGKTAPKTSGSLVFSLK